MTFASEIVQDAAAFIMADEGDISLEPNEFAQGTRILNDFCAELFESGVDLGYRPVSSSGDPVTVPHGANLALKQNLALLLAPMFAMQPDQALVVNAQKSLKKLKARYMKRIRGSYPTTLPVGAGNSYGSDYYSYAFYPFTPPEALLRLAASSTITISAINTPVIVDGWTVDREVNIDAATGGTIQYDGDSPFLARIEAALTVNAASSDQFTFYLRKNSAVIEQTALAFDADAAQNLLIRGVETLRRGDVVSLAVENNDATNDLVITNGNLTVR